MKIKVKEEHIKNGQPENCENCAVALAVKDSLKASSVSVTVNHYDDSVEIKDVDIKLKDAELVVESVLKNVKLEIKSGI